MMIFRNPFFAYHSQIEEETYSSRASDEHSLYLASCRSDSSDELTVKRYSKTENENKAFTGSYPFSIRPS